MEVLSIYFSEFCLAGEGSGVLGEFEGFIEQVVK